MIVKYKCNSCGREKTDIYRGRKAPKAIKCEFCKGVMIKQLPKIRTVYKNEGFTKHIEKRRPKLEKYVNDPSDSP